jgi:hypothetical protein
MPSRRLMSVAAAIEPDDLSICDIGRRLKSKAPGLKSKVRFVFATNRHSSFGAKGLDDGEKEAWAE